MTPSNLHWLSATTVAAMIRNGDLSSEEVTHHLLARIAELDPTYRAYATLTPDQALAAAQASDRDLAAGTPPGPLHGVPVALKDLIHLHGVATGAGSRTMTGVVPGRDAAVTACLRRAGAIFLGKTVTHEFGCGSTNVPTRNAWDPSRASGGSSAGSGVAVALGTCFAALGTDTAGSVRMPAALNGIVGFKPSRDALALDGVLPMSRCLDTVGILTRTIGDAALVFEITRDTDPGNCRNPIAQRRPTTGTHHPLNGVRLGVDREQVLGGVAARSARATSDTLQVLIEEGAEIVELQMPKLAAATAATMTILSADLAAGHRRRIEEQGAAYDPETLDLVRVGEAVQTRDYAAALRHRSICMTHYESLMAEHRLDALVTPGAPCLAEDLDGRDPATDAAGWLQLTALANLVGGPALSMPSGLMNGIEPTSVQLLGRVGSDCELLHTGHLVEAALALELHPAPATG